MDLFITVKDGPFETKLYDNTSFINACGYYSDFSIRHIVLCNSLYRQGYKYGFLCKEFSSILKKHKLLFLWGLCPGTLYSFYCVVLVSSFIVNIRVKNNLYSLFQFETHSLLHVRGWTKYSVKFLSLYVSFPEKCIIPKVDRCFRWSTNNWVLGWKIWSMANSLKLVFDSFFRSSFTDFR